MRRTINIILIVLILAALGVLGYYLVQPEESSQAGLQPAGFAGGGGVTALVVRNQEFIQLLRDLNQTNIERSFFDTQIFQSLREFGRPLNPQPKGRSNPFAPFGVGNVSQAAASGALQTGQSAPSASGQ